MSDLKDKVKMFCAEPEMPKTYSHSSITQYIHDMNTRDVKYRTLKDPRVSTTFHPGVIPFADFLANAINEQAIVEITTGGTIVKCVVLDLPATMDFLPVIRITKEESYCRDMWDGETNQRHRMYKLNGVHAYIAISSITMVSYSEDEYTFDNSEQFK